MTLETNNGLSDLIIVGASGFGSEVAWLVERINRNKPTWHIVGFLDDSVSLHGTPVGAYTVLGGPDMAINHLDAYFVCSIGAANVRKKVIDRLYILSNDRIKYANLVDPSVPEIDLQNIGSGNIICAGSILTVNYKIGNHVIINLSCTIGHDAVLNDFVTLYPTVNVSGNVIIFECTEIGTGSQIIQGKQIGSHSIIGAGSVVVRDIPAKCTAVGVPAVPIKYH